MAKINGGQLLFQPQGHDMSSAYLMIFKQQSRQEKQAEEELHGPLLERAKKIKGSV